MRYGADQSDWSQFTLLLGLEQDLLPVISNPNATISPASALKKIGQIPSLYTVDRKVVGLSRWTERQSTAQDIAKWSVEPDYGICLQTRRARALDCDITDPDLAAQVFSWINTHSPVELPVRGRSNASKFLMPFRLPGDFAKRVLRLPNGNEGDKIEFLATGQQFVAVGTHPSGVRYEWRGGLPTEIPALTAEQFETLWLGLKQTFKASETKEDFSERKPAGGDIDDEATLTFLEKAGAVLGWSQKGSAYVTCPFKSGHSKEGDKTETIYFPKGLRGYTSGHFKCMHASCAGYSDDDFLTALGYWADQFDVVPEPTAEEIAQEENKIAERFKLHSLIAIANRPRPRYIIKSILPMADLGVLFGESTAGKSFVALDMMMSIARGVEWNGFKTIQGQVAYVCAEGSGGLRNRIRAYAQKNALSDDDLAEIPLLTITDAPNFMDAKDATAVALSINRAGGASVIVVDTFAQTTAGANENSGEDVGKALSHCRKLSFATGAVVVLVHHAGKDLTKGARGWSGLRAAADFEIEVSREGKNRKLKISKQKDGEDGAEFGFELEVANVDLDEDDAIITSCSVKYIAVQRALPKETVGGKNKKMVLNALDEADGQFQCTNIIDIMINKMPWDGKGRDRRRELASRAIRDLVNEGVLVVENNELGYPSL